MDQFTEKQIRNGADQGAEGHNTAIPGPMDDVAALKSASESAEAGLQAQAKALWTGGGVGNGIAPGAMFEWDDGLAIAKQPGEAG